MHGPRQYRPSGYRPLDRYNPPRHRQCTTQRKTEATAIDAEITQVDADLVSELIAAGATTQPVETVITVLTARRNGASINAAAKASGINYRTAHRIVRACPRLSGAGAWGGHAATHLVWVPPVEPPVVPGIRASLHSAVERSAPSACSTTPTPDLPGRRRAPQPRYRAKTVTDFANSATPDHGLL